MSSAAVVGAGAIGAWIADALDRAGWRVSILARGETLSVLRTEGLRVQCAAQLRHSRPETGSAAELGIHDYVFLAVKAHALPLLAEQLQPLFGSSTVVVSMTNGIPWWFFHDFGGPLAEESLRCVDPERTQERSFPRDRALGAVVHASARVIAPGYVEVVAADRLLIGEPGGRVTGRVAEVAAGLKVGGINAQVSEHIRHDIWAKLWGNMNMSPVSALTRASTGRLLADTDVRELCLRMMQEMQHCAEFLGLTLDMTPAQRMDITRRLGDFRPSMLADLEAGRTLELDPQLGAVVEIANRLGVPAPFCRSILGLTRLLGASAAL